ncbi:hypothetical protein F2Q70_00022559 [Brassica cretica]|uniref:Uncharacterized protein n=1 Tax=Brassica cretica TaxID=69181 RepID=A0A3N6QW03_BRACR|nr:hypothetical protein F2Q70_00022559 [Brassica cretica]KAF3592970.1 hypothetical protein DY000_02021112 [Brassica cretica]
MIGGDSEGDTQNPTDPDSDSASKATAVGGKGQMKEVPEATGDVNMWKLMEELESMSGAQNLSNISTIDNGREKPHSSHAEESGDGKWALISHNCGLVVQKERCTDGCVSPNGFQVLQDIREEGEIDEDDVVPDEDGDGNKSSSEEPVQAGQPDPASMGVALQNESMEDTVGDGTQQRQGSNQRSRG